MSGSHSEWVRKLMEVAKQIIPKDFIGSVRLNCFMGGITNANVEQSVKLEQEVKAK